MTSERKGELRRDLAIMIEIAWRNGEFNPEQELSSEDMEYIEARIEGIVMRLWR